MKRCSSERGQREKRFYGDGKDERRRTVVATVSNWGGSALEAAAHALFPAALDDLEEGVERAVLEAICAAGSVDGKYVERPLSVDGMAWEPVHREFYEMLWGLAKGES